MRYLSFGFNKPEAVGGRVRTAPSTSPTPATARSSCWRRAAATWAPSAAVDGLDHPAGLSTQQGTKLFVSDSFHDRVLIYDKGGVAVDNEAPNGVVSSPTSGQALTAAPIVLSGSATDNVAVDTVRLSIRRGPSTAYVYWDGAAWTSNAAATVDATLASPGATSTAWSYSLASPVSGSYRVTATAVDSSGLVDLSVVGVPFTLRAACDATRRRRTPPSPAPPAAPPSPRPR